MYNFLSKKKRNGFGVGDILNSNHSRFYVGPEVQLIINFSCLNENRLFEKA